MAAVSLTDLYVCNPLIIPTDSEVQYYIYLTRNYPTINYPKTYVKHKLHFIFNV